MGNDFHGAKVALFIGNKLLVTLRDDYAHIPFPNVWDLPGGGREGSETPLQTLKREVIEEVGLALPDAAIIWERRYPSESKPTEQVHFFVARMRAGTEDDIVFGDEGQAWRLMPLAEFLALTRVVPSFAPRLWDWMSEHGAPDFGE